MKQLLATFGLGLGGLFWCSPSAHGQFMLSPVAVTESGLGTFGPTTGLTNMVSQSGLASAPFVSGQTGFDAYFTPNNKFTQTTDGTKWQSALSFDPLPPGNLDFDLSATFKISKLAIWNESVKDVIISVAATQAGLDSATPVGTFTLTNNTLSGTSPFTPLLANIVNLGAEYQGRYLRLRVLSQYQYPSGSYYATIGELVVSGLPVVGPPLSMVLQPNGNVTVNFTGTLQSKINIQDIFQNVSGNPQGTYTILKASLGTRRIFRTSD